MTVKLSKIVNVRVDYETYRRLAELAAERGVGLSALVRSVLEAGLLKREIEARGWQWQSASCWNGGFYCAIFGGSRWIDDRMESAEVCPKLSGTRAKTEEAAIGFAFRKAMEVSDGEKESAS